MTYQLIGSPLTRTFRVIWLFEELQVDYQLVAAAPRSDESRQYNPAGKVPILIADSEAIIDSSAALQYLADRHERFTQPPGTIARAKQDSFLFFALDDLDGVLWTYAKHDFVLPKSLRQPNIRSACEHDWTNALQVFSTRLGTSSFVMGDTLTVPDFVIGHCMGWAERVKFPIPPGPVRDYIERMRDRPAFQKAMAIRDAAT